LPLESVPHPEAADDVLTGERPPPTYRPGVSDSRPIEFTLGRLLSEPDPFEPV
jgi:hypothetical protein